MIHTGLDNISSITYIFFGIQGDNRVTDDSYDHTQLPNHVTPGIRTQGLRVADASVTA